MTTPIFLDVDALIDEIIEEDKHAEAIREIARDPAYLEACSRKNCFFAALWFLVRYTHRACPAVARFPPEAGGVIVGNLTALSGFYAIITNTEKKKESKSNFAYALRQSLDNLFLPIITDWNYTYYFHPGFLPEYPENSPITAEWIVKQIRPWIQEITPENRVLLCTIAYNTLKLKVDI